MNFKKCLFVLTVALPLSMTTFAAMTGDEAYAFTQEMYSNYKVGKTITVTERGEIFKKGKFHCAYESIESTEVLNISGDNFEIQTVYSDNLNEECKLTESYRDKKVFNINQESQEILEFGRFMRDVHGVDVSLNIEDKKMIFVTSAPKQTVEVFYEGMTPIHFEAELSQSSHGKQGDLSFKSGRPDVKVQ